MHENISVSAHFQTRMIEKGVELSTVLEILEKPEKVTEVRRYPGQLRFFGQGLAIVVDPQVCETKLVTLYADGVVTPMRPDQLTDPMARASNRLAQLQEN